MRALREQAACLIVISLALLATGCWASAEATVSATSQHAATPPPALTPTVSPTTEPVDTLMPEATPERTLEAMKMVTFTILYDNNAYEPALRTDWGFACLVEAGEATVLFDTGGNGAILMDNMATLGFDPRAIDVVVLSHAHGDHTGGLAGLLDTGASPVVYVPAAFPASFKADVCARTDLVEVTDSVEILPGIYTSGEVGSGIVEQALVVETGEGVVVITGCAHPGVVEMVRRSKEATGGEGGRSSATPLLVMGGFHLGSASRNRIETIIADLRDLGVQRVAPCHCTGDVARQMFADAFGADCTLAGVGQVFVAGGRE
jgi:7,8-dihydropterin-6-yl-methyl-4-(beta-D-ribofuranosyl)aminobenzene 5'-phosphate synthase